MITYLSRLTHERDSLTEAATDLTNKAATEERDLTETEKQSLGQWAERCAEIDGQLTEYGKQAESQRAYARLRTELDTVEPATVPTRQPRASGPELEARSWGDAFVGSDAFREYPGAGTSRRVEVPFDLENRAAISVGTLPGAMVPPYTYTPATYTYQSPLLDVVGKTTTSSGSIQYVQWTPNPQAAASVVLEGELKPEAVMSASIKTASLVTLAHHKAITRQALEDVPQIRSTVENRLRQGITVALEEAVTDALLAASIPPVTGSAAGGDTLLGAIREGVATVQAAGYGNPNAVLLNPADWAALDIATVGNAGRASGQSGFWGMRAVAVPALPAGTTYVGNFQLAVQLFTRAAAEVMMTDSHADYFVRNIILLLAEIRAVATVPDPAAAAKCSVGAVTATGGTPSGGK
jgi:HK97 family phage major capsid protein